MQSESTKRCTVCGDEKPLDEYATRRASHDGKTAKCKPCYSEYMREQRVRHRDRRLEDKRAYYRANTAAHAERGRRWRADHPEAIRAQKTRWVEGNRERYRAAKRAYNERLRRRVLDHYSDGSPSCACCGEARYQFLALDHTDGGGNEHRRSLGIKAGSAFCRWVVSNGFPPLFRVLCHNCNAAMGYYGSCPHEDER